MKRKGDGNQVAINVENDRLVAVWAVGAGDKVVVKGWLSAERPPEVDGADAGAMGGWIGAELKKAGMQRAAKWGSVIFAVPRGEVVLKRITFPPGGLETDLPGMVHLQMVRQLTVSPESAAIDFVPIPTTGLGGPQTQKTGTTVLAGALQGDRIQWRLAVAKAAGVTLGRVALKSAGAAALLAEISARRGGGVLGIAVGCGSTEFVVVEDGQLVFARATDLVRPDKPGEEEAFADKVAVEAKRTWMSYRVTPDSAEVEVVMVLGADEVARRVATRCGEALELAAEAADFPAFVEVPDEMPDRDRAAVAPLVGLIAEPVIGRATLDFANPRKSPDAAAKRRQRVLLGALGLIVVVGGAYSVTHLDLNRKRAELDDVTNESNQQSERYSEFLRARARAEHIDRWSGARVDWLSHISLLNEQMPRTEQAQLESLTGRAGQDIWFTFPSGRKQYADGKWTQNIHAVFILDGKMARREIADALRQSLVSDERYKLESTGADLADHFDFKLTTSRRRPDEAPVGTAPKDDGGKQGPGKSQPKPDADKKGGGK